MFEFDTTCARAGDGEGPAHAHFHPLSYNALFDKILKNVSIRKRPPASFCDMCCGTPALTQEIAMLDAMTSHVPEEARDQDEQQFPEWHWGVYKTRDGAVARMRSCIKMEAARKQHKNWVDTQRTAVGTASHLCTCSQFFYRSP